MRILDPIMRENFTRNEKWLTCDPDAGNVLPGCVYVLGSHRAAVFIQQWEKTADTKIGSFTIMFDAVLQKMASRLENKNISFALELRANGTMWITRRRRFEPLFTLSQRDRSAGGLSGLVPNPYFLHPDWWDTYTSKMAQMQKARPWESRKPKVLFRGACGPGGQARLQLMLAAKTDARLDVGFSRVLSYNNSLTECIHDIGRSIDVPEEDLAAQDQLGRSDVMPQEVFSEYQFIIQMPGAATGAYSRGLQYLFMHGSVVLIWENDSIEFYYQQLIPRVHFMPVNANTLSSVLDELQGDPELCRTLLEGAKDAMKRIVSAESVYKRWEAALIPILDRQIDPMVLPPDACSCNVKTGLERCKHCEYVDFLHERVRRKQGEPDFFNYSNF